MRKRGVSTLSEIGYLWKDVFWCVHCFQTCLSPWSSCCLMSLWRAHVDCLQQLQKGLELKLAFLFLQPWDFHMLHKVQAIDFKDILELEMHGRCVVEWRQPASHARLLCVDFSLWECPVKKCSFIQYDCKNLKWCAVECWMGVMFVLIVH